MEYSYDALLAGKAMREVVVRHPKFNEALTLISNVVQIGNSTGAPAGVRIIAPAGSGKTFLFQCLRKNVIGLPILKDKLAVIYASLKESPAVAQIQNELLSNFQYDAGIVRTRSSTNNEVNLILLRSIKDLGVKLIVLDEFQHIFLQHGKVSITVVDWVKRLMNETEVPVVLIGTEMLDQLAGVDPQLTTRVPTSIRLGLFRYDKHWLVFLKGLADSCDKINLSIIYENYSREFYTATNGTPRLLKSLLIHIVILGVTEKREKADISLIQRAYELVYGPESAQESPFATFS